MHNHRWTRLITTLKSNNKKEKGVYICLCNVFSIVSTGETSSSSSLQVVHCCSNTLYWWWKDMSEMIWMGNSPAGIFMHLVEEYVMRSCRYPTVKTHWKVVANVYIGLYWWFVSLGCCWSVLYILGGLCAVWVLHEKYLSVKFEYVSFPMGLCGAYICAFFWYEKCTVWLCRSRLN